MKPYTILYEDDVLIAVDKPSGILVIPAPGLEADTLTAALNKDLDGRGITVNAYPCHRLDRETSGVILYAKGKKAQKAMMEEFQKRAVKKTYVAIVQGSVKNDRGSVRQEIYNKNKKRLEPALTHYKVSCRKNGFTILEIEPVTGRTNQIRIHMKAIGHPVLGEDVYAFRKDFAIKAKRLMLHAHRVRFLHPVTGAPLTIESPVPAEFGSSLQENFS
ncbi:MAG: RluA family pseudouridine synthase [Candidatus Omnitrophica bacterium]|nr:RluA family pseudouridine synthase [Candidatus Omnitrophota bacterium]